MNSLTAHCAEARTGGPVPDGIAMAAAGDSLITQAISHSPGQDLLDLKSVISAADVRFTNLEMLLNDFEGYPAADSGGAWLSTSPDMIEELKWMGFNLFACANNHTMDWCWEGLRAHMQALEQAGVTWAGAGEDAARARAPAYLDTACGKVALVGLTTTISNSGRAGQSRVDCQGRPGANALRYSGGNYNRRDAARILDAIREARDRADWVLCSVHSHEQRRGEPGVPLRSQVEFCRASVEAGADAVICHGPHVTRGIEVYLGKPVFHGLGNFIFQPDTLKRQPADFYEQLGLGWDASLADAFRVRDSSTRWAFMRKAPCWESIVPVWRYRGRELADLRLYPVTLGFELGPGVRGSPALARGEQARRIIERIGSLSRDFGVKIDFAGGTGVANW